MSIYGHAMGNEYDKVQMAAMLEKALAEKTGTAK